MLGGLDGAADLGGVDACAFGQKCAGHAVQQAQGVHHKFACQILRGNGGAADGVFRLRLHGGKVFAGVAAAVGTFYVAVVADFAVRACTDADVVAKLPVV